MTLPTVDLTESLVENLHEVLRAAAEKGPLATDEMTGATVVLRHRDLETLARDQRLNGIGLALFDMMGITNGPLRDWYSRLMFTTEATITDGCDRSFRAPSLPGPPRRHDGRNGLHRCRFGPGRCLEKGRARGLTIHPGSWQIEYARGAVVTTLPFAMVDTLPLSLEVESVRRSTVECTRLLSRRFRR